MTNYRYSAWDGTQLNEMTTENLVEQLTEQILEGDTLQQAMRRMMERGMVNPSGRRFSYIPKDF